jgi:hypothetical protein
MASESGDLPEESVALNICSARLQKLQDLNAPAYSCSVGGSSVLASRINRNTMIEVHAYCSRVTFRGVFSHKLDSMRRFRETLDQNALPKCGGQRREHYRRNRQR